MDAIENYFLFITKAKGLLDQGHGNPFTVANAKQMTEDEL